MAEAREGLPALLPQSEVPRVYSRIAPIYDVWAHLTETRARRRCLELAAVRDGEDVLEIAVGTGLAFRELVKANPSGRKRGIDLTPGMLARAQAKTKGLPGDHRLSIGDATALEFEDASFDVVINNYMFDLLPEEKFAPVLREMARVLRPQSRLVLVNLAKGTRPAHRVYEHVYRANPALLGGCRGVEMAPHALAAGFRDVTVEHVTQFGFPSEVVVARKE